MADEKPPSGAGESPRMKVEIVPPKPSEEITREVTKEVVDAWFADKGNGDHACPVCGTTQWTVEPNFVTAPVLYRNRMRLDQGYAYVVIHCSRCALATFFHAGAMGFTSEKEGSGDGD